MPELRRVQLISSDPTHCPTYPCMYHGMAPAGAVYIGHKMPGLDASPLANPYNWKTLGRAEACDRYRTKCLLEPQCLAMADEYIGDNDIACWCKPWEQCHGDVLAELLAGYREPHDTEPWELA